MWKQLTPEYVQNLSWLRDANTVFHQQLGTSSKARYFLWPKGAWLSVIQRPFTLTCWSIFRILIFLGIVQMLRLTVDSLLCSIRYWDVGRSVGTEENALQTSSLYTFLESRSLLSFLLPWLQDSYCLRLLVCKLRENFQINWEDPYCLECRP